MIVGGEGEGEGEGKDEEEWWFKVREYIEFMELMI